MTEDLNEEESPAFMLRKTTARTACRAAAALPAAMPEAAAGQCGSMGGAAAEVQAGAGGGERGAKQAPAMSPEEEGHAMEVCSASPPSQQQLQPTPGPQAGNTIAEPLAQACLSGAGQAPPATATDAAAPTGGEGDSAAMPAAASPTPGSSGQGVAPAASPVRQPTLAPKRPKGRAGLFVRPLELPPSAAEAPAPKLETPPAAPQVG
jgi:hypothetical protein